MLSWSLKTRFLVTLTRVQQHVQLFPCKTPWSATISTLILSYYFLLYPHPDACLVVGVAADKRYAYLANTCA